MSSKQADAPLFHLVTTRGKLTTPTIEAGRPVHNMTAGNPEGVKFAQAMSDLSHNVYVPLMGKENDLLFLDVWHNPATRKQFFSNPQVEEGGKALFASYERTIWLPAQDIVNYYVPTRLGQNERYLGLIRGVVKSRAEAKEAFDEARTNGLNAARLAGSFFHQIYFREAESAGSGKLEVLGVDFWASEKGMMEYYEKFDTELKGAFASSPEPSVWKRPAGDWIEW